MRRDSAVMRPCIQCTHSGALSRKVGRDKVIGPEALPTPPPPPLQRDGPDCAGPRKQESLCTHWGEPLLAETSRNKEIEENYIN